MSENAHAVTVPSPRYEEPPAVLYKYTGAARVDVLVKCKIAFSLLRSLNDVYEERLHELAPAAPQMTQQEVEDVGREIAKLWSGRSIAKNVMRIIGGAATNWLHGTSRPQRAPAQWLFDLYDEIEKSVGVLSLGERPDDLLMWSHYAEQYRGLVLGLRTSKLCPPKGSGPFFNRPRPVMYCGTKPPRDIVALDPKRLFMLKSAEWHYEPEWRVLRDFLPSDELKDTAGARLGVALCRIPPEAIDCVYIGPRADPKQLAAVRKALNSGLFKKVRVYQGHVSKARFAIDFRRVTTLP